MSDTDPGEAGWQPDPTGKHDHRYWDGSQWTENVSDAGVASTDPYVAAPEPGPTDPTVTEPVPAAGAADPTTAFSAGGPPPPMPAPLPVGEGGGGGSKRGLLIGGGILVIVALIVAALALGGGDDDDDVHGKLVTALTDEQKAGLNADDADCVADYLVDNVDHDTLAGLDYESNDAPDEIVDELNEGFTTCNVGSAEDATSTTESSDDPTTTTEAGSSTDDTSGSTGTGADVLEQLRGYLEQTFGQAGLSQDQAACLADKMIEAYSSGDISEEDFLTKYQDYFKDCDIDPEDINGD